MRIKFLLLLSYVSLSINAQCPDSHHPHLIDLGLTSGKFWSCCNVGASSATEYGGYYAYGETLEKTNYNSNNYTYYEDYGWTSLGTKCDISSLAGNDAAYKNVGTDWRMPTNKECEELVSECTWQWMDSLGVTGYKVTGKNGNCIFLPAAGFKSSTTLKSDGTRGLYRSSVWTMAGGEANTAYDIDFNSTGVKVTYTGYKVNGQTIRPIYSPLSASYVVKSFLPEQKNKETQGFTTDGSSKIRLVHRLFRPDKKCDLKFYIDGQEVDSRYAGKVDTIIYDNNTISVTLVAPNDYFVSNGSEYVVKMEITPYYSGVVGSKKSMSYKVERPGVLFIHGLNDTATKCWSDMVSSMTSAQIYDKSQMLAVDYSGSNNAAFDVNTTQLHVIKKACEDLCKQMYDTDSIASCKYDMVGHSMGGILARLYVQDDKGKESTNKIITVNTPHFGALMGNTIGWMSNPELLKHETYVWIVNHPPLSWLPLGHIEGENNLRAIKDLAIGSTEIQKLNGESSKELTGIPVHAICTYFDEIQYQAVKASIEIGASLLLKKLLLIPSTSTSFGDGVVGLPSQKGGLSGDCLSVFRGGLNAFHCNSPHWGIVKQEIADLLYDYKDSGFFSLTGFGTSPSNAKSRTSSATNSEDTPECIDHFNNVKEDSYIKAQIKCVNLSDSTYKAKIDVSSDISTYLLFAVTSDSTMIYSEDCPEPELDLSGISDETLKFYVVGRTNYDALVLDSVTVNLTNSSTGVSYVESDDKPYKINSDNGTLTINANSSCNSLSWNIYGLDAICINSGTTKNKTINISNLKPGVQIIKITIDGNTWFEKILIQ